MAVHLCHMQASVVLIHSFHSRTNELNLIHRHFFFSLAKIQEVRENCVLTTLTNATSISRSHRSSFIYTDDKLIWILEQSYWTQLCATFFQSIVSFHLYLFSDFFPFSSFRLTALLDERATNGTNFFSSFSIYIWASVILMTDIIIRCQQRQLFRHQRWKDEKTNNNYCLQLYTRLWEQSSCVLNNA